MKKTIHFAATLLLSVALVSPLFAEEDCPFADCPDAQADRQNPIFQPSISFLANPLPVADSVATTEAEMKPYDEIIPGTEVTIRMIPIPGGRFMMGSPESEEGRSEDESPQHEVQVKPFWMGETTITWIQFRQFQMEDLRKSRPATGTLTERERTADAFAWPTPAWGIPPGLENQNRPGYPASAMTIYAAQMYCRWLTILTGRYYRLPTEAEWEYAARAGTTTAFSFGDDDADIDDYAWWFENSFGDVERVRQLKPNAWGLYDMHGNVAEWVLERWAADTYANRQPNRFASPVRPAATRYASGAGTSDVINVLRGGSADSDDPAELRSARRLRYTEQWRRDDPQYPGSIWWLTNAPHVGFRIVRPLGPPATAEEARQYEPDPEQWWNYRRLNNR